MSSNRSIACASHAYLRNNILPNNPPSLFCHPCLQLLIGSRCGFDCISAYLGGLANLNHLRSLRFTFVVPFMACKGSFPLFWCSPLGARCIAGVTRLVVDGAPMAPSTIQVGGGH